MTTTPSPSSLVYTPHALQREMHQANANNKVLEWARRLGKSRSAFFEMVKTFQESLSVPVPASVTPPFHAWIVCPSFPQAEQVWTELMTFIPQEWYLKDPLQERKQMTLKGAPGRGWALIEVKSAHDPEALQTAGLDFLWVTECQDIDARAFQKLRPMLRSPHRMSRAIWEGIPATYSDHWFWKLCDYARDAGNPDYFYSHGTYEQNPFLTQEQLEDISVDRHLFPRAAWERMYMAERSENGGFFKNIDACLTSRILTGPLPGRSYVMGLDLGRKADSTVVWVLDREQRTAVYTFAFDQGESWAQQRETVKAIYQDWQIGNIVIDATGMGGDMFTENLMEDGLPVEEFVITEATRTDLLNSLAIAFEDRTVAIPNEMELLRQLRAFQYVKTSRGKVRPDHPPGEHDDQVFALALGLSACAPPAAEMAALRRGAFKSSRYVPTQQEAESGSIGHGFGRNIMRQRREAVSNARLKAAGFTLGD